VESAATQRALQLATAASMTVTVAAVVVTVSITVGHLWPLFS
jgi:hypothetical protein